MRAGRAQVIEDVCAGAAGFFQGIGEDVEAKEIEGTTRQGSLRIRGVRKGHRVTYQPGGVECGTAGRKFAPDNGAMLPGWASAP